MTLPQAAAVCVRDGQVLLISSRETGRWVIPKGNVERHESHADCAAREAMEEAGIIGQIDDLTLGHYQYLKERRKTLLGVAVFRLTFSDRLTEFREMGQRNELWLSPADAADLVSEEGLKAIFLRLAEVSEHSEIPMAASGTRSLIMQDDREKWVARRAYDLWEQAGRPDGYDHEHWSQASYEWEARQKPSPVEATWDEEERLL